MTKTGMYGMQKVRGSNPLSSTLSSTDLSDFCSIAKCQAKLPKWLSASSLCPHLDRPRRTGKTSSHHGSSAADRWRPWLAWKRDTRRRRLGLRLSRCRLGAARSASAPDRVDQRHRRPQVNPRHRNRLPPRDRACTRAPSPTRRRPPGQYRTRTLAAPDLQQRALADPGLPAQHQRPGSDPRAHSPPADPAPRTGCAGQAAAALRQEPTLPPTEPHPPSLGTAPHVGNLASRGPVTPGTGHPGGSAPGTLRVRRAGAEITLNDITNTGIH